METDLLVVGGGPAGLIAAASAARHGARVVLVDERPAPGGALLGQLYEERTPKGGSRWVIGSVLAEQLAAEAAQAGVQVLTGCAVWGIWPDWAVYLRGMNGRRDMPGGTGDQGRVRARGLILATGSTERGYALPNWTLPGVMTAGTVRSLLHTYRVTPGEAAIVVGADPAAILAARQLALAGVRVRGVVLPPPGAPGEMSPGEAIEALARFAGTTAPLELDHVGRLLHGRAGVMGAAELPPDGVEAWGVPIMLRRALLAVRGEERVIAVEVCDLTAGGEPVGRPVTWAVDTVVLSAGVSPLTELTQTIGCRVAYVPELGGTVPVHSPQLESTVEGVFVAGSMLGLEATAVALAQGRLAGLAACARLGVLEGSAAAEHVRAAEEALASARRAAPQLLPKGNEGRRRVQEFWRERGDALGETRTGAGALRTEGMT